MAAEVPVSPETFAAAAICEILAEAPAEVRRSPGTVRDSNHRRRYYRLFEYCAALYVGDVYHWGDLRYSHLPSGGITCVDAEFRHFVMARWWSPDRTVGWSVVDEFLRAVKACCRREKVTFGDCRFTLVFVNGTTFTRDAEERLVRRKNKFSIYTLLVREINELCRLARGCMEAIPLAEPAAGPASTVEKTQRADITHIDPHTAETPLIAHEPPPYSQRDPSVCETTIVRLLWGTAGRPPDPAWCDGFHALATTLDHASDWAEQQRRCRRAGTLEPAAASLLEAVPGWCWEPPRVSARWFGEYRRAAAWIRAHDRYPCELLLRDADESAAEAETRAVATWLARETAAVVGRYDTVHAQLLALLPGWPTD